jgi:hypothetical protein
VALTSTQPPVQWVPALFPRVKTAGAWRCATTPSKDEVKERAELYFYKPAGPSRFVIGRNLILSSLERHYMFGSVETRKTGWEQQQFTHASAMPRSPSVVAILASGYGIFIGVVIFSYLQMTN